MTQANLVSWPTKEQDMGLVLMVMKAAAIANNGHLMVVAEQRYTATGEEEIVLSDWIFHIAKAIEAIHRPLESDFIIYNVINEIAQLFLEQGMPQTEVERFKQLALRLLIKPTGMLH